MNLQTVLLALSMAIASSVANAALVATYQFQNTLAADQSGITALAAVDPLGLSGFQTATLYGQTRRVYHFSENSPFAEQAGLSLDTTGLVTPNQYSLEIIFAFDSNASPNGYRRLVDTHERATDNGLYAIPTNNLQISGFAPVRPVFNPSEFHHLVVTNISGSNVVSIFLDGAPVITTTSNVLDISNAAHVLNFFLDDSFEYSSGQIGLVRLYDSVLGNSEVAAIALNPLPAPVPLPTIMWLLGAAVGGLGLKSRRNNLGHSYPK